MWISEEERKRVKKISEEYNALKKKKLSNNDKTILDFLLDKAYEFIDGIDDWGYPNMIERACEKDPEMENNLAHSVRLLREKLELKGESAWIE